MRHSGAVSEAKRVAVLSGGWSSERDVSLVSGKAVADALRKRGFEVITLDPPKDLVRFAAQLVSARPDIIFNALHGTGGEDGIIQGALDMAGIPYTHSRLRASAVAMDKKLTKLIAQHYGVKVAEDRVMTRGELAREHPLSPPYVVKPLSEGSSVGVTIVQNDIGDAAKGDPSQIVLVERFIPGQELTVAVLDDGQGPQALGITRLVPSKGFYDYEAKYTDGVTVHQVNPTDLPEDVALQIKTWAVTMHRELGCSDVSRSDFRYNQQDGAVFLEINTHPGMTGLSLVPEQAAAKKIDFPTLIVTIIETATSRFAKPIPHE
jgi:D-alanine-D-alanine ligase